MERRSNLLCADSGRDSARLDVKLFLRWSAAESLLRKWAQFRLVDAAEPRLLRK